MATKGRIDREEIIGILVERYGLPPADVRRIVASQFWFIKHIMEKGDFEAVRLRHFGEFKVDGRRLRGLELKKQGHKMKGTKWKTDW